MCEKKEKHFLSGNLNLHGSVRPSSDAVEVSSLAEFVREYSLEEELSRSTS